MRAACDDELGGRHIACTLTSLLVAHVREQRGSRGVAELLERAGSTRDLDHLESTEGWVSLDEATELLRVGVEMLGDEGLPRKVGENAVRRHAGSPVATLLRSLGSPEAVMQAIAQTAAKFSAVSTLEAAETGPGRAVVRSVALPPYRRTKLMCEYSKGLMSTPPSLFGLPLAHVEETACQADGAPCCEYVVTWDAELASAAADPEQRVTALEAQYAAVSARLRRVFATAADLVSADDLPVVLARIVERTAGEIRATGYVLAVTLEDGAPLQVYRNGLGAEPADTLARAALSGALDERDDVLVAPVVSSMRDYGRLVVITGGGHGFFEQEREALELYAKHAAAVLDVATALEEAARRHAQVSALLGLAHALARAGTSAEAAARLADGVASVVDCDTAGAWLWSDEHEGLRLAALSAVSTVPRERREELRGITIAPADTPHLERMLRDPRPAFFDGSTDDPLVRGLMDKLDLAALAVVPIVARERFLGLLIVSVQTGPERLRLTPDVHERLSGVAALAAPALETGRLVDELEHKARHDGLTGVLNRAGFAQRIGALLDERGERERAGLLFVDLDGFKEINDAYGHDVGDELLRHAAARLAGVVRREDAIGRLGGDEFAVVLASVRTEPELEAAAARVRAAFAGPFTVAGHDLHVGASVGQALWPDAGATAEALLRHADAEMYREKASGRAAR